MLCKKNQLKQSKLSKAASLKISLFSYIYQHVKLYGGDL